MRSLARLFVFCLVLGLGAPAVAEPMPPSATKAEGEAKGRKVKKKTDAKAKSSAKAKAGPKSSDVKASKTAKGAKAGKAFSTTTGSFLETVMAFAFGAIWIIVLLCVVMVASMWAVFKKAGKPGWGALVPIYGQMCLGEMAGLSSLIGLLVFIPYIGFVFGMWITWRIGERFGCGPLFRVGLIFLPLLCWPILAFGSARYVGEGGGGGGGGRGHQGGGRPFMGAGTMIAPPSRTYQPRRA